MRDALLQPLAFALAVVAGLSFVTQGVVNARLRSELGSPSWAAFASYLGGTVVMAIVLVASRAAWPPLARVSWWGWSGGLLGAIYVLVVIALLPRLGAATLLALLVLGQMLGSLLFDAAGAFGLPRHPIDLGRIAGVAFLIAGVVLVRR